MQKGGKNYSGALFIGLIALLATGALFYYIFSLAGLEDQLVAFAGQLVGEAVSTTTPGIDLSSFAIRVVALLGIYLLVLTLVLFGSVLSTLLIGLVLQRPVIRFLDVRMLPGVGEENELKETTGMETYTTKPGEQFETIIQPSWWATHAKNTLPTINQSIGKGVKIAVILSSIGFSITLLLRILGISFPFIHAILLSLLVVFPIILATTLPKYWREEWLRDNTLYILFTHTLINLQAGIAEIGILLGSGSVSDPKRQDTTLLEIGEIDSATNPRAFDKSYPNYKLFGTIPIHNWFLDILGGSEGLRTLFIRSHRLEAQDILLHIPHGNGFRRVMSSLIKKSRELTKKLERVEERAHDIMLGEAGDESWSIERGEEEAKEFKRTRTAGLVTPQTYNLYTLKYKKRRWDQNGNPINRREVEDETGQVRLAPHTPAEGS